MKNFKLVIFLLFCKVVLAQQHPGDLDTSFMPNSLNRYIYDIVMKDDGKILIGTGAPNIDGGIPVKGIISLNPDGSFDTSFNAPDDVTFVKKIALQDDGKIIILGNILNNGQIGTIARLNPNGSLDSSFNVGTSTSINYPIETAVIQDDGKIVISGTFTTFNGIARNKIARLNADGSLDGLFAEVNGLPTQSYSGFRIFKQADGKIILAGRVSDLQTSKVYLSRLNSDGTVDASFNSQIFFTSTGKGSIPVFVSSIQTRSDGKILIVGDFLASNGSYSISMLNNDGSIDADFDSGVGVIGNMDSVAVNHALIEPSGKIILVGSIHSYYVSDFENTPRNMLRINSDGSIDSTFPLQGPSIESEIFAATLQSDGKILIGGYRIIRLISDINLGLPSEVLTENVILYPNPVKNSLIVKSTIVISEIEIYNSIGQVMSYQKENFSEKTIDMKSFPAGIYFVKITSDTKYLVRKIIKI